MIDELGVQETYVLQTKIGLVPLQVLTQSLEMFNVETLVRDICDLV